MHPNAFPAAALPGVAAPLLAGLFGLMLASWGEAQPLDDSTRLSETLPLEGTSDLASDLVDGVDRFLLREIQRTISRREGSWPHPGPKTPTREDYELATAPYRERYRQMIGLVDPRVDAPRWIVESQLEAGKGAPLSSPALATVAGCEILSIRWPVHEGFQGRGLAVVPGVVGGCVILVPDAGQMPEELCGLGTNSHALAIELAQQGLLVVIPQGVGRQREPRNGRAVLTDQEYLYRSAFVLGRHLLGHLVQQCLAAVDAFQNSQPDLPIAVAGWGEGGWIALAAAAADPRIAAALVSGHFGPRERIWEEPIHRNVHGLLEFFGDAQLAALVAPRTLVVDAMAGPEVDILGEGGAPGRLRGPDASQARSEWDRASRLLEPWRMSDRIVWTNPEEPPLPGRPSRAGVAALIAAMQLELPLAPEPSGSANPAIEKTSLAPAELRRIELLRDWDRYQQRLLELAHVERESYWKRLDTSNLDRFRETVEPYREEFRERVIGRWPQEKLPPQPRSRLVYDEPRWRGYEIVLNVFEDVIACGVLLVPKSESPVRGRPCVVFQHGLEGRPSDTIVGNHPAYHDVSARLAEEGYVVFAPQNLYLFQDRFRTLQRKSNPLGKTLFSTIVAQHEQIVRWLAARPEVDPERIAFYGLSYGGKSAMRIPALVPEYCLSICSADFNDWVWKNASTSSPYSYVWTMEYEIFEFDLGRSFNYAEMATLIAPRPFMVERGHFDGVAPDERVALEYAKVRHLYAAKLGLADRTQIEFFVGPHTIHGAGTFQFLKQHLSPEKSAGQP